jgi:hypothetical protein
MKGKRPPHYKYPHGPNWESRKPTRPPNYLKIDNLTPKLVKKEIHGQEVWVKVYPARYARGEGEKLKRLGLKKSDL